MRYLLTILLVAVPLAGTRAQTVDTPPTPDVRLRPGDVVRLQVEGEGAMNGDYPVLRDGTVLLPMVGLMPVGGRPFDEAAGEIRAAYGVELRDASVTVTPVLRVAVLGEVRQPGLMHLDPTYTLTDVLAAAGGLTPDGAPDDVTLLRDGRPFRLSIETGAVTDLPPLRSGDQLVVGRRSWIDRNLPVLVSAGGTVVAAFITSLILR